MKTENTKKKLEEILHNINNNNFENALALFNNSSIIKNDIKLSYKLLATIYFKKGDWQKSIDYYEKRLPLEEKKYQILNNIGVALFKLGKIHQSIKTYKESINENNKFDLTYENLGIAYKEIGIYDKAINVFVDALKLNKNNINVKENLLSIFNIVKPKNTNIHPLIECNSKIRNLSKNILIDKIISTKEIKKILYKSENIISSYNQNFNCRETQILKKNSTNLNCERHFKIFNKFKVIPKFCFNCYKIQIELINVVDLIRLYFLFDNINLKKNNIRKCIIETRANIKANYKGYVYCDGLNESKDVLNTINSHIPNLGIKNHKVFIKHGCSEYAEIHPKYKKINFDGPQEMKFDDEWLKKEKIIDDQIFTRNEEDETKFSETLKGINLYDIFIIKNWLNYAKIIGDNSYKEIFEKKLNDKFLSGLLKNQLDFRKKELLN